MILLKPWYYESLLGEHPLHAKGRFVLEKLNWPGHPQDAFIAEILPGKRFYIRCWDRYANIAENIRSGKEAVSRVSSG